MNWLECSIISILVHIGILILSPERLNIKQSWFTIPTITILIFVTFNIIK